MAERHDVDTSLYENRLITAPIHISLMLQLNGDIYVGNYVS